MDCISVVGLGKLGLPLAACFADSGYKVIGVDVNKEVVDAVNQGVSPMAEPGLDDIISRLGGNRLIASANCDQAIEETDVTFILVSTPSNNDGSFSNRYIEEALATLAIALKKCNKPYHVFVISSTVTPCSTENSLIPIIEQYSGKTLNRDFGVCYNPDFVALGNIISGFKRPELVVIGESNPKDGQLVGRLHAAMCENAPPIKRMSIINAEVAKVSLNAYITVKISFANSLANLCEQIPGANVDEVTNAIGLDSRISPLYLKGGLSFGGTCFPRDTRAYISISEKFGVQSDLIIAADRVNRVQDELLTKKVLDAAKTYNNCQVAVLGMSFKPKTPVIVESPGVKLVHRLLEQKIKVIIYDELAIDQVKNVFNNDILYADSLMDCLQKADVFVVTHMSRSFKKIIESYSPEKQKTIIDCWRDINPSKLNDLFIHIPLGCNI